MSITEPNIGFLLMVLTSVGFAFVEAINVERKLLSDFRIELLRNCKIFLFYVGVVMYEPMVNALFWRSTYAIVISLVGYGCYLTVKHLCSFFLPILMGINWHIGK